MIILLAATGVFILVRWGIIFSMETLIERHHHLIGLKLERLIGVRRGEMKREQKHSKI